METLPRLQEVEIKSEVQRIIAELDVALSFLREADETSDKAISAAVNQVCADRACGGS